MLFHVALSALFYLLLSFVFGSCPASELTRTQIEQRLAQGRAPWPIRARASTTPCSTVPI